MTEPDGSIVATLAPVIEARLVCDPTPRRLFHGRGHRYPGAEHLSIDRLGPIVIVTCHARISDHECARLLDLLLARAAAVDADLDGVVLQLRDGRRVTTEVLWGDVPDRLVVEEAGLRYCVRPLANQNVGLFLDVAPLRGWLRERCQGGRVLNLFAYTCAFSVAALAGGAAAVVNLDMSRPALAIGRENHLLNGHELRRVSFLPHNLFKSWWKLEKLGPFDWVIIDPPTRQRGSFDAERDYRSICKRLSALCRPGSEVLALLNSPFLPPRFLTETMARWAPALRFEEWLAASPDFDDAYPDRALKIARFRAVRG